MSCTRRPGPPGAVTWTRTADCVAETVGSGQFIGDSDPTCGGPIVTSSVSANGGEALCSTPFP